MNRQFIFLTGVFSYFYLKSYPMSWWVSNEMSHLPNIPAWLLWWEPKCDISFDNWDPIYLSDILIFYAKVNFFMR